jgi:hypothetical protein
VDPVLAFFADAVFSLLFVYAVLATVVAVVRSSQVKEIRAENEAIMAKSTQLVEQAKSQPCSVCAVRWWRQAG